DVRRLWPDVLVRLREIKRTPWSLISQQAAVVDVTDGVLTLAFRQPSLRDTFVRREDFQANLRQAVAEVLLVDLRIEAIVDPAVQSTSTPSAGVEPPTGTNQPQAVNPGPANPATGSDDDAHPDDRPHEADGLSERELLERTLGARVIEEIEHG
ncbi:MAG TPA: hypothetical protein VIP75_11740, partial [Acidothermales bacterium]